jgi:hypothetical protein
MLLLLIVAPLLHAQSDDEWEPEPDLPYVGAGAGFAPVVVFMNLDELNTIARTIRVEEFSGPLILWGGNLVFSPAFFPNWRIGAYGAGGFKAASSRVELNGQTYIRALSFTVGHGGPTLERAIRMSSSFTILPGVVLVGGSYAFGLAQTLEGGNEFPAIVNDAALSGGGDVLNRYARFISEHIFIRPTLYFEYAFPGTLMLLRAGAGYNLTLYQAPWRDDAPAEIRNVPDLKPDGLTVHVGISGGLFSQ